MLKVILSALLLGLLVIGGVAFGFHHFMSPVDPSNHYAVPIEVPSGSGVIAIASTLYDAGLIRHEYAFRLQLMLNNEDVVFQAGQFYIAPSFTLNQIIAALQTAPRQLTITTLPGWRLEEFADYFENMEDLINFDRSEFENLTNGLEGQLSANTFQVFYHITTEDLVDMLINQFNVDIRERFADLQATDGRDWNEILTMASLLQREARGFEEMRIVAGLLESRLAIGMPLQLCATMQFCRGRTEDGRFWNPPRAQDRHLDCVYNTYRISGLPPRPISAVSPDAVEAALTPVETDYYYFIHGNDGIVRFASTYEEHLENIERYLRQLVVE
ncbi:MAG: endolytic transglycosylase MltG [Pseudomonadales bacterium]|jgi:UPF0755 protein|nr:endolytic transglycosylase MltG [Pseudomonadales bacterium]